MEEEISEDEDKFATWMAAITKATLSLGSSYLLHKC
ncbi:hypothetical protein A2U01_0118802, partial [Trifolium medium]|nr:hypothetical protein [Trifolium medium]